MNDLIDNLVEDLKPIKKLRTPKVRMVLFFLIQFALIAGVMWIRSPFPHNLLQLYTPIIALQFLFFLISILSLSYLALGSVVPGYFKPNHFRYYLVPVVLLLLTIILSFFTDLPEKTQLAEKRGFCELEVILLTVIPLTHLGFMLKKGFLFDNKLVATATGAASFLPAGIMHIACHFSPTHTLIYHFGPILILSVLAGAIYNWKSRK